MAEIIGKEVLLKDENGDVIIPYVGYASSGRNVGDIFYTSRLDTELNGAVECNGGVYSTNDFSGSQSIGNLLSGGKLPYVSLEEYESIITTNGSCRAFGWDGGDLFRVPLLNDVYIEAGNAESVGEFISESLPNITGNISSTNTTGCVIPQDAKYLTVDGVFGDIVNSSSRISYTASGSIGIGSYGLDASRSSSTYQDGAKVKPDSVRYRAMVQLAIKTTDDAVITATSALQQLANKADRDLSNLSDDGINYINDTINNIITSILNSKLVYDSGDLTLSSNTNSTITLTNALSSSELHKYQVIVLLKPNSTIQNFTTDMYLNAQSGYFYEKNNSSASTNGILIGLSTTQIRYKTGNNAVYYSENTHYDWSNFKVRFLVYKM